MSPKDRLPARNRNTSVKYSVNPSANQPKYAAGDDRSSTANSCSPIQPCTISCTNECRTSPRLRSKSELNNAIFDVVCTPALLVLDRPSANRSSQIARSPRCAGQRESTTAATCAASSKMSRTASETGAGDRNTSTPPPGKARRWNVVPAMKSALSIDRESMAGTVKSLASAPWSLATRHDSGTSHRTRTLYFLHDRGVQRKKSGTARPTSPGRKR